MHICMYIYICIYSVVYCICSGCLWRSKKQDVHHSCTRFIIISATYVSKAHKIFENCTISTVFCQPLSGRLAPDQVGTKTILTILIIIMIVIMIMIIIIVIVIVVVAVVVVVVDRPAVSDPGLRLTGKYVDA